jgi:hypothetical protein
LLGLSQQETELILSKNILRLISNAPNDTVNTNNNNSSINDWYDGSPNAIVMRGR